MISTMKSEPGRSVVSACTSGGVCVSAAFDNSGVALRRAGCAFCAAPVPGLMVATTPAAAAFKNPRLSTSVFLIFITLSFLNCRGACMVHEQTLPGLCVLQERNV